ncbi:uncharacterized protein [Channa argus]|uniref:uncharacterized protein isoform X2 n=1 Tax=Channa argus TaxID=215402 RepID=UPI003521D885
MASSKFLFYLTCLFLWKVAFCEADQKFSSSQHQESRFVSVNVGENVTLQCFYKPGDTKTIYWYKQSLGEKPCLVSTRYVFNKNGTFYDEFNKNPRFKLDIDIGKNHLMITDLQISDSASYYCARSLSGINRFFDGTVVSVNGSGLNIPALIHQSVSGTIQPGGSVTLDCTVHTGTCGEEYSVYWVRDSSESLPQLIYTHGDRSRQRERKPEAQTQTCFYNFPVKTYYCAVASCGYILFGNRTKLEFEESQARQPSPSTTSAEDYHDAANLHYAALSVNLPYRSKRQRSDTSSECLYSRVKL